MPEPRRPWIVRYLGRLLRLMLGAFAKSLGTWIVWLPVLALIWLALGRPTVTSIIHAIGEAARW
jgi:hypothetical protein